MARRIRAASLENRTNRLKLAVRKKPFTALIAPNISIAYRRNEGAGTWSVKCNGWLKRFALADDYEDANGDSVMTYWQALDRAKALARADEGNTEQLASLAEAIDNYEADLERRGGRKYNATQLRLHVSKTMQAKTVALFTEKELHNWRLGLIAGGLMPSSADRIAKSLRSALNLAAANDDRINNASAWKEGLKKPDDEHAEPRNVILPDETIAALVHGAYEEDHAFGLIMDALAETGNRESQLFRLKVHDLQDHLAAPRLMMPSSRKGKNRKKNRSVEYRPLPISVRLAKALRQHANRKRLDAPLFDKMWDLSKRLKPVIERLRLDDDDITPYALRHSSIVRQLLRAVPIRLVAAHHDTSVAEIERTYSRFITGDPSEALTRATLLDLDKPARGNVVALKR
ncbi:site-specific recombinase XerD [Bradyrhizobium japonicum]|uniref:site-specific integrase n=1 Tax=Bradyrhizobium japonicum TaxID=375 RepID=UPI0021670F5B|nr:site-specific integrase [Bradyrhizobium japonicum]MCS3497474.1 site-specific recombinase XerD [Bradyrhizobium japonicum]MCS3960364.1 site-specific recombinase XerD [Bradyrhizobium japonicum]MCS4002118.1 site-specific recombinase XerD [Bradyrhizobium japonicum]